MGIVSRLNTPSEYGTGACCKRCILRNARYCKLNKLFLEIVIKIFNNAIDGDACRVQTGIAQWRGGDAV